MNKKTKNKQMADIAKPKILSKEKVIDIISLIVAVISLVITIHIGIQANNIAIRSQPLDYSVSADEQVQIAVVDGQPYTMDGITFKQEKGIWSGDLSSVFLATVIDGKADIVYVPDKMDDEFGFGYRAGNRLIYMIKPDDTNKLFFGPIGNDVQEINDTPQAFHFIFKGYNNECTIYTVVYTVGEMTMSGQLKNDKLDKNINLDYGYFNIYVLNEDNMYDYTTLGYIANDLNANKSENEQLTVKDILKKIIEERNICYEKIKGVN